MALSENQGADSAPSGRDSDTPSEEEKKNYRNRGIDSLVSRFLPLGGPGHIPCGCTDRRQVFGLVGV
jgi:hypothetical protein